jgi:acetyl-CoA carboxylase biotin carboxyl carrier protein
MGLSADDLAILLDSFEGSEWTELVLSIGGTQVALTKSGAQPVSTVPRESTHDVLSPSVGIFRRAPEPGAQPFVEVGDRVEAGQVIAVVQVLRLVVDVKAGASGAVQTIHMTDGEMVEHGQVLFTLALAQ